jgi:hypothetical protein
MCIVLKCFESVLTAEFSVGAVQHSGSVTAVKLCCVYNEKYQAEEAQDFEATIF